MKKEDIAPVVLFVYNRLEHTRKTIESLQLNVLAPESELYIYSDGYKSENDRKAVEDVRVYLSSVTGFKKIQVFESEKNQGLSLSIINGVSEVLKQCDRVIVMEDDLITTTDFLTYMNDALEYYSSAMNVFSISGYTFPSPYLRGLKEDVFLYPRPASWGWATWKNRWEKADWEMSDFQDFSKNKSEIRKFIRGGGDMFIMLLKQQKGLIQSWAIRWAYTHFKYEAYSLYLKKSKVKSIGTDNSGTNLPSTTKYDTAIYEGDIRFVPNIKPDHQRILKLKDFYKPSLQRRVINFFKFGLISFLKAE